MNFNEVHKNKKMISPAQEEEMTCPTTEHATLFTGSSAPVQEEVAVYSKSLSRSPQPPLVERNSHPHGRQIKKGLRAGLKTA